MLVKFKNITNVTYTHLKHVVSSDNLRPVMCGVYIDFKEQKLVATDAHVLIAYPIEITENDSDLEGVIVPVEYFNKLRYMIPLPKPEKKIRFGVTPETPQIEYILMDNYAEIHLKDEMIYRIKYIEGKYPRWNSESVMINPSNYPNKPEKVAIGVRVLKRFLSGIPTTNPDNLIMETTATNKSVIFTTKCNEYSSQIKGIVMPVML